MLILTSVQRCLPSRSPRHPRLGFYSLVEIQTVYVRISKFLSQRTCGVIDCVCSTVDISQWAPSGTYTWTGLRVTNVANFTSVGTLSLHLYLSVLHLYLSPARVPHFTSCPLEFPPCPCSVPTLSVMFSSGSSNRVFFSSFALIRNSVGRYYFPGDQCARRIPTPLREPDS